MNYRRCPVFGGHYRLQNLPPDAIPWIMCEWKFTSSFKNMQRVHVMKDAAKLQLLSEFLQRAKGVRPELLQVIFNFPGSSHEFPQKKIVGWYKGDHPSRDFPHVQSIMIMPDGSKVSLAG